MTTLRGHVERWIDETLDGMMAAPRMYGSTESVELQAILLMELRAFVARPDTERDNPRRVFELWVAHFKERHPDAGNVLLWSALDRAGGRDHGAKYLEITGLLESFRESLMRDMQPENPFALHDLALVVRMRKGRRLPPAARVGAFYGLVGQVMRSVVRRGGGRGKLQREYEEAITVFPAGGFEVVPENGIGAQIVMPFDWPQGPQPALPAVVTPETIAREAFTRFVNVAAWASDEAEPIQRLMQAVPDMSTRTRMALDAMRLLPPMDGDIEAVEVGGRAILRELPVSLRAEARERLLSVLTHDQEPTWFDGTGTLRMVDLDEGRLRLLTVKPDGSRESVEVWLTGADAVQRAAGLLGRDVRVEGRRFTRASSKTFVVDAKLNPTSDDDGDDMS